MYETFGKSTQHETGGDPKTPRDIVLETSPEVVLSLATKILKLCTDARAQKYDRISKAVITLELATTDLTDEETTFINNLKNTGFNSFQIAGELMYELPDKIKKQICNGKEDYVILPPSTENTGLTGSFESVEMNQDAISLCKTISKDTALKILRLIFSDSIPSDFVRADQGYSTQSLRKYIESMRRLDPDDNSYIRLSIAREGTNSGSYDVLKALSQGNDLNLTAGILRELRRISGVWRNQ